MAMQRELNSEEEPFSRVSPFFLFEIAWKSMVNSGGIWWKKKMLPKTDGSLTDELNIHVN